jgi:Holliday junction DNA helicase RuvB
MAEKFGGGPVGLSTLAIAIGEEADTVEDVFEPYLLQQGLVKRTPRGRVLTERGYEHLGIPAPKDDKAALF